jgi:hypothetical protein
MCKDTIVAKFKVFSRYVNVDAQENHDKYQSLGRDFNQGPQNSKQEC